MTRFLCLVFGHKRRYWPNGAAYGCQRRGCSDG